jgi:hypothetical protein
MAKENKSLILLLVLFFLIENFAADAQDAQSFSVLIDCTTKDLKRIDNLSPKNLRVTLNHNPINMLAVRSEGPRRIVYLMDASGSITDNRGAWEMVITDARDFIAAVPKNCSLAFIAFGSGRIREVGFGEDRQKVVEALEDVARNLPESKPARSTVLYDAIQHAIVLLNPARPGDAIYVATDGMDIGSKAKMNQLKESLLQKQIRLFLFLLDYLVPVPISIGPSFDPEEPLRMEQASLLQLSTDTIGQYYILHPIRRNHGELDSESFRMNPNEMTIVSQELGKLHDLIFSFYRIDLDLIGAKKNSKLDLELLDQNGRPMKGVRLIYGSKLLLSEYGHKGP